MGIPPRMVRNARVNAPNDIPLSIRNRGWDRYGISLAPFATGEEQKLAGALAVPPPLKVQPRSRADMPWARLAWWESEWQAAIGIEAMCSRPFLYLDRHIAAGPPHLVPTRVLYPHALQSSEKQRIEESARYVAAMVRQAREFYSAAASAGVTDLSRPVLYFYGALALAKAATVALFGRDQMEKGHGLESAEGPSTRHAAAPWRNIIEWKRSGEFVMLYRAARWDPDLYKSEKAETRAKEFEVPSQPRFHLFECIRWLGYDWGEMPATGFETPGTSGLIRSDRQRCLLMYRQPGDEFMQRGTPLDAPLYQVPLVVVQYMVLYGFSVIARYNGLDWQELLAAANEPEGYVFRVALENVAEDFVEEIAHLLPRRQDNMQRKHEWFAERPELDRWYIQPVERTGGFRMFSPDTSRMEEWHEGGA